METTLEQKREIREEQLMLPTVELLTHKTASISQTLDELFPEQERYDKNIKLAKQALGTLAWELTSEQLQNLVPEVQYLCESWLDDFERTIFKGQTLKELLHEKGGGK